MKLKYISLIGLPLAVLLAGCSSDSEPGVECGDEAVAIELGYSLSGQNMALGRAGEYDTQLAEGALVGVTVEDTGDNSTTQAVYVADASGAISLYGSNPQLYFPLSGAPVNIAAVAGMLTEAQVQAVTSTDGLDFTLTADQTTPGGYAANDICFGYRASVPPTKGLVNLPLTHQMSKVEVMLTEGAGATDQIAGLSIENTLTGANMLAQGDACTVTAQGAVASIAMQHEVGTVNEAILVPQTVAANTELVKVSFADGYLAWCPATDYTFLPGKRYVFNLTVQAHQLQVTLTVNDWTSGASDTDISVKPDAEEPDPVIDLGAAGKWARYNYNADYFNLMGEAITFTAIETGWDEMDMRPIYSFEDLFTWESNLTDRWEVPTTASWFELKHYTTQAEATVNGVHGVNFTANGNTLFIPDGDYWTGNAMGPDQWEIVKIANGSYSEEYIYISEGDVYTAYMRLYKY